MLCLLYYQLEAVTMHLRILGTYKSELAPDLLLRCIALSLFQEAFNAHIPLGRDSLSSLHLIEFRAAAVRTQPKSVT